MPNSVIVRRTAGNAPAAGPAPTVGGHVLGPVLLLGLLTSPLTTLLFEGGEVPRGLRDYVFVNVKGDADAIRQIVRALPIELGPPRWRTKIYRK